MKQVRLFHEDNARTRYLTAEEEDRLLAACSEDLKPLVITAMYTGLRKGELLSLTWGDVDLQQRQLRVQASYSKNGRARTVTMNALVLQTLQATKDSEDPMALVFTNGCGRPYRYCRDTFERACRKAGIEDFTFHDLRHTFASRLVMAGIHLAVVEELLGHTVLSMTMRYAHLAPSAYQGAVDMLARVQHDQANQRKAAGRNGTQGKIPLADAQTILQALAQLGVVELNETAPPEGSHA